MVNLYHYLKLRILVIDIDGIKNAMAVPYKDEIYGFKIKLFMKLTTNNQNLILKIKYKMSLIYLYLKMKNLMKLFLKNEIIKTSTGKNIKILYQ